VIAEHPRCWSREQQIFDPLHHLPLLDRLTHRVHTIEANGPSYRLRKSKQRLDKRDVKTDNDSPEPQQTGSSEA